MTTVRASFRGLPWLLVTVLLVLAGTAAWASAVTEPSASARPVDWSTFPLPTDCQASRLSNLVEVASVNPSPSTVLAVIVVTCDWMDGTAPAWIFTYRTGSAAGPRLAQTLLRASDGWVPGSDAIVGLAPFLHVTATSISLEVAGYLGGEARCCATVFTTLRWQWSNGAFIETTPEPAHDRE